MVEGDRRLDQPFVEVALATLRVQPELLQDLMAREEAPAVEKRDALDEPAIDSRKGRGRVS